MHRFCCWFVERISTCVSQGATVAISPDPLIAPLKCSLVFSQGGKAESLTDPHMIPVILIQILHKVSHLTIVYDTCEGVIHDSQALSQNS